MFLKIEGHLLDILGEAARGNIKEEFGIEINPTYQFLEGDTAITLAIVVDAVKAEQLTHDNRVTVLNSVTEFNTEIDTLYQEKYILVDSSALLVDLQLSKKTTADILGYDINKGMQDQINLKALYEAGLSGIKKSKKPSPLV